MKGDTVTNGEDRAPGRLFEWVTDFEPDSRPSLYARFRMPFVVFGIAATLGGVIVLVAALWPIGGPGT